MTLGSADAEFVGRHAPSASLRRRDRAQWLSLLMLVGALVVALGASRYATTKISDLSAKQQELTRKAAELQLTSSRLTADIAAKQVIAAELEKRNRSLYRALGVADGSASTEVGAVVLPDGASPKAAQLGDSISPYATMRQIRTIASRPLYSFVLGLKVPPGQLDQVKSVTYNFSPLHYKVHPALESEQPSAAFEVEQQAYGCSGTVRLHVASSSGAFDIVFDWCKAAGWKSAVLDAASH